MIRVLLLLLAALAVGAAAAHAVRADAGYVLLSWREWVVETTALGFAVALLLGLAAVIAAARLLLAALRLPGSLRYSLDRRRIRRARASFEMGLRHYVSGQWKQAEVELVRRAADHPAGALNYLFAAQAAARLGAEDRRERYLAQAAAELDDAVVLARAEAAHAARRWDEAEGLWQRLLLNDPRHALALERLGDSYAARGRWGELRELLQRPETGRSLSADVLRRLQHRALQGLIAEAVAAARLDQLKAVWEAAPAPLHFDPELRLAYVRGLTHLNAQAEAEAHIVGALREDWHPGLAEAYGALSGRDPVGSLATVEGWLQRYGEKPELLLLAARACARNRLWGKAQSYLEGLLRLAPSPAGHLELAQLMEQTHNAAGAAQNYKKGLELRQAAQTTEAAP